MYVNFIYNIVKDDTRGFDAVYEDTILELVGTSGLEALKEAKLVETCGVMNGRQLYVLCRDKKES